jgi:hypothetical protein
MPNKIKPKRKQQKPKRNPPTVSSLLNALTINKNRNRNKRVQRTNAPVNMGAVTTANQATGLNQKNSDRLLGESFTSTMKRGTFIYNKIITPSVIPRLAVQASLYQRVKFLELRFEIQTQTSTAVSGGYVAAWVNDPSIEIQSGEDGLTQISALRGTKTTKFWESTSFSAPLNKNQLFYCAPGAELRLYSPGRFVVMSDGPPSGPVEITVTLHWHVHLTEPVIQTPTSLLPQLTLLASYIEIDSGSSKIHAHNKAISGSASSVEVAAAWGGLPDPLSMTDPLFYKMPQPLLVQPIEGASHEDVFFMRLSLISGLFVLEIVSNPGFDDVSVVQDHLDRGKPIGWQGYTLTPVAATDYLGTAVESGFWIASPQPSVNGQLMISRRFQKCQPTESLPNSNSSGNKLLQMGQKQY